MKIQINRFSTHQTAKVMALLLALSSLIMFLPFMLLSLFISIPSSAESPAFPIGVFTGMFFIAPIFYALMGYIMTRIGLWIYNLLASKVGGIEFEYQAVES